MQKRVNIIAVSVILLITCITFWPSINNEFTNWDDDVYVLENPLVVSNDLKIAQILKTPVSCNYHPITILSLALDYQNGELDPRIYHIENLLFHLLNTLLVFLFVLLISNRNMVMASISALFFGIHPMHVESVAWISERKDVLYVFFFLAGLITYLNFRRSGKKVWYICTFGLFLLSCLSKGMAVVFPLVLMLIDYLLQKKWERKILLEKLPFLILSLVFGVLTFKIQLNEAISYGGIFTIYQRIMFASYGAVMYVVKFFAPFNLSAYYAYPTLNKNDSIPLYFHLMPLAILLIVGLIYFFLRKERPLIFGLSFYFVTVVLVLQFVSVGTVIMADRYSYLSYLGLLYPVAYYSSKLWNSKKMDPLQTKYVVIFILCGGAVMFSYQANARTQIWKNSETLWTDVIIKQAGSYPTDKAYQNRGKYYHSIGKNEEAILDFNNAIRLNPGNAMAYNNRGNIYRERNIFVAAFMDYNRAIAIDSTSYLFYGNRALVYQNLNQPVPAMEDYAKSIAINPFYWANYYNRGLFYLNIKDYPKSISDFTKGISLNFNFSEIYYRRGVAYYCAHNYKESIADFSKAIELTPNEPSPWIYRALSNTAIGKKQEAEEDNIRGKQLLGLK